MVQQRMLELTDWMRSHHGVVTRTRLIRLGYAPSSIHRFVASGRMRPLWPGVYVSADTAVGRLQIMTAICQLHPFAAIGFTTAGAEWGFRGMADSSIHVLVPHATTPALVHAEGLWVHRCRRIDPVDIAGTRADGIRLTSPPRTLFDCAAILDREAVASAIEQALADRRCTMETLVSTMTRLRHPRRPGALRFQQVLTSRPKLRGAARSVLEIQVRDAISAAGLPQPHANMWMRLGPGEPIRIDLAWPDQLLAVEVDHPFWHDREVEAARDKRRDRKLATQGWLPLRLSQLDVEVRLTDAVADLRTILIQRGWTPAAA